MTPFGSFVSRRSSTLRPDSPWDSPSPSIKSFEYDSDSDELSSEDRFVSKKATDNHPPIFNPKELAYIQKQMTKSKYGLAWNWLAKDSKCSVSADEEGVTLVKKHSSTKRQGDCRGLSIQLSRKLASHFKGQYKFYVAINNRSKAWDNHFFLLAWPTAQDQEFKESSGWDNKIPKGAMIIDPSFGWIEQKSDRMQNRNLAKYSLPVPANFLMEGSALNPDQTMPLNYNPGHISWLPLGYLKDLEPKFKAVSDQAFVSIGFLQQEHSSTPQIVLQIKDSAFAVSEGSIICKNWRKEAHPGSPLYKVLTKMEKQLQPGPVVDELSSKGCLGKFFSYTKKQKPEARFSTSIKSIEKKTPLG